MVLITGSEASGKRTFARSLGFSDEYMSIDPHSDMPVVFHAEQAVFAESPDSLFEALKTKDIVIINEVGSGVIPAEKEERLARERAGRLSVMLSSNAKAVVRMVCGIPVYLKGGEADLPRMASNDFFADCLEKQLKLHPSIEPRDVIKMAYQAAFGAEHLLSDKEAARRYLAEEWGQTLPSYEPLYEQISEDIFRVNIGACKRQGISKEDLFEAFAAGLPKDRAEGEMLFGKYIAEAESLAMQGLTSFSPAEWHGFLSEYLAKGIRPVHHSESYREKEKPAYRIVLAENIDKLRPDL